MKKLLISFLLLLSFFFGSFDFSHGADLLHKQVAEGVYDKLEKRYKDKSEVEKLIIYGVISRKLDDLTLKVKDKDIKEVVILLKEMLDSKTGIQTSSSKNTVIERSENINKPAPVKYSNPRFTKVDALGYDLPDDATDWSCVKDHETGLLWEVKWQGIPGDPDDAGISDADAKYRFFKGYTLNSGGGTNTNNVEDSKICLGDRGKDIGGYCNFNQYLHRFRDTYLYFPNAKNKNREFCGVKVVDFNIPTKEDLRTILDKNKTTSPKVIDLYYFPGTMSGPYIAGKVYNNVSTQNRVGSYKLTSNTADLGYVNFGNGIIGNTSQTSENYIRLVAKFDKNNKKVKQLEKRFVKISATGKELPDSATNWSCVKDTKLNVMWEKKVNYAPNKQLKKNTKVKGWSDANTVLTWYNPNTNLGYEGSLGSGINAYYRGVPGINEWCYKGVSYDIPERFCNTYAFTTRFNNAGLCGYSDWRLPTKYELFSIYDKSKRYPYIDKDYFPNTAPAKYWTSQSLTVSEAKNLTPNSIIYTNGIPSMATSVYAKDFGLRGGFYGDTASKTGGVWNNIRFIRSLDSSNPNSNYTQPVNSDINESGTDNSASDNYNSPNTRTSSNSVGSRTYGNCNNNGGDDTFYYKHVKNCIQGIFNCNNGTYRWGLNFSPSFPPDSGEKLYKTKSSCESANNICSEDINGRLSGDIISLTSTTGKFYGCAKPSSGSDSCGNFREITGPDDCMNNVISNGKLTGTILRDSCPYKGRFDLYYKTSLGSCGKVKKITIDL